MNKYIKGAAVMLAAAMAGGLTSCLEEAFPTTVVNQKQVEEGDKYRIANALPAFMIAVGTSSTDLGYPCMQLWRDTMTGDNTVQDESWDFYGLFCRTTALGGNASTQFFWNRYYAYVYKANLVLQACNADVAEEREYIGNARAYRALFYMDLGDFYEYRPTGVAELDAEAESRGIMGLTVPLQTETTTEDDARHNPRVPFTHLYRFILTDLNLAEKMLAEFATPRANNWVGLGAVYGLKARLYMRMGSRFDRYPADLEAMEASAQDDNLKHLDPFGCASAHECYAKAAEYARKAIDMGYTPTTEAEWYDVNNGFNTPVGSWIWSVNFSSSSAAVVSRTFCSWPGFVAPEATWGYCGDPRLCARCIDARLFGRIKSNDWRRRTWIAPEDAANEEAYNSTYASITQYDFEGWSKYIAYAGFKFRPAQGEMNTSTIGNAVNVPLMRVEEMYLIEAEAKAMTDGPAAGKQLLESFMNSYRVKAGTSYRCLANDLTGVVDEIMLQKRIELWGEGLIIHDINRLGMPIEKGYEGTNWPAKYRYNSLPGYRAPWTVIYIPNTEATQNTSMILNPNPSQALPLWTGK